MCEGQEGVSVRGEAGCVRAGVCKVCMCEGRSV